MWLALTNAFVSVVAETGTKNLLVRARKREHLKRIFPGHKIQETPERDYRFRTVVSRDTMAKRAAQAVYDIDYPNFKNSVKDHGLHDLYSGFWMDHNQYQHTKGL